MVNEARVRGVRESMPSVTHERGLIAPPLPREAPLGRRLLRGLVRLGQGLYFHDAFRVAPAMAFHFFLSLLPLLVFSGWVLGSIVQSRGIEAVLSPLLDALPTPATRSVVAEEVERLAGADTLGPLAALGFLWLASGGVHGLMDAVETVIGSPRRSWLRQRSLAFGWVVAALAVAGVASFGVIEWDEVVGGGALGGEGVRVLRGGPERALALVFSLAGAVAGLAAFYRFSVSHPSRVKRRVLPGAALAVMLWLVTSWGFGLYVRTLAEYAVFYGSLAVVAVLLLWLWLASLAILVGAELNAQLEGLRD